MKYLYFAFSFLFLGGVQLDAQNFTPERRFEGGLIAGFNITQIDGDLLYGFHKIGLNVGGKVDVVLSERWRAGIEFLFVQHGASRSRLDNTSSVYDDIKLNMVEVPLMAHFRDWKMQASAGVSYGRIFNSEIIDITGEDITETIQLSEDVFSIILGGGFHFTENWFLDIRWSRWLNNIRQDEIIPIQGGESGKFIGRSIIIRGIYTF